MKLWNVILKILLILGVPTLLVGCLETGGEVVGYVSGAFSSPSMSSSVTSLSLNEGSVSTSITLRLSRSASKSVTLSWSINASAGQFAANSGSLIIAAGADSATLNLTSLNNAVADGTRNFVLSISGPAGEVSNSLNIAVAVVDDDLVPTISIGSVSVSEGNSGTTSLTFTITASSASTQNIVVNYLTSNGTANAGSDYISASGTATISAGSTTTPVVITINGDITNETDETFTLSLNGGSGYTVSGSTLTATGTILNDDYPAMSWAFTTPSDYSFNSNFVDISGNKATLKSVNTTFNSSATLNAGTHFGTFTDNSTGALKMASTLLSEMNSTWAPEWSSLRGYWKMNETSWNGTAGQVADSSGAGNSGTAIGSATTTASGKFSYAGTFSAANHSVSLPASSTFLPTTTSQFTISAWVYPTSIPATSDPNSSIFTIHRGSVPGSSIRVGLGSTDKFGFYSHSIGVSQFSTASILLNTWTHVALTYNGSCYQIFINGSPQGTCYVGGLAAGGSRVAVIGGFESSSLNFVGRLDEVAFWNKSLSAQQLAAIYFRQGQSFHAELSPSWAPRWSNLLGYWKMDSNWLDSSGNNRTATISAGTPSTQTSVTRIGLGSALFASANSDVLNLPSLGSSSSFTMMAWVRASTVDASARRVFSCNDFTLRDSGLGNLQFASLYGSSASTTANLAIKTNTWTHIAATFDGSNMRLYLNGALAGSTTASGTSNFTSCTLSSATERWNGYIDDVGLWNRALFDSEVAAAFHRQKQTYAAHYESPIIDLGHPSAPWPQLSSVTTLPFLKELPATSGSESATSYSSVGGNLMNSLVGYWPMSETSLDSVVGGNDFADRSGNAKHGVEGGGVIPALTGRVGLAAQFDGTDDRVSVGNVGNFNGGFTVGGWVRIDGANTSGNTQAIFSQRSSISNYDFQNGVSSALTQFRCYFENTSSPVTAVFTPSGGIRLGVWYHHVCVFNPTAQTLTAYVNGVAGTATATGGVVPPTGGVAFIGSNNGNANFLNGAVDEMAAWSRNLSATEVREWYRRGANRLKYQVRSCIESTCSCKSLSASPAGSVTDCDGDGIPNSTDASDMHSAVWFGADGTALSSFSELQNNSSVDAFGNPTGNVGVSGLNLDWSGTFFSSGARPIANRYFQFRVLFESDDDNNLCSSSPCLPELASITVGPAGRLWGGSPSVINNTAFSYGQLQGMSRTDINSCTTYQISIDNGTSWRWWSGSAWTTTTGGMSESNYLSDFTQSRLQSLGTGNFKFKAFLNTNTSGDFTQACELSNVGITYTP